MQLVELLNSVSGGWYPPLSDVVRDVDTNAIVKAKKRTVRAHTGTSIIAIIIRELGYREKAYLSRLVF